MDIWLRRLVVTLFWFGIVLFSASEFDVWMLSQEVHNPIDSAYNRFYVAYPLLGDLVHLGGLWCGVCGFVSLLLIALAGRLGHDVEVRRFYIWVPILLSFIWLVILIYQLGQAR